MYSEGETPLKGDFPQAKNRKEKCAQLIIDVQSYQSFDAAQYTDREVRFSV